jgi:hypothetical protein
MPRGISAGRRCPRPYSQGPWDVGVDDDRRGWLRLVGCRGDRCRTASGARAVAGPTLRVRLPSSLELLAARRLLTPLLTTALNGRGQNWTTRPAGHRSPDTAGHPWTLSILLRIRCYPRESHALFGRRFVQHVYSSQRVALARASSRMCCA